MLVGWHGITINKQVRREMGCLPSGAFVFHFISVENVFIIMQRTGWTVIPLDLRGNIKRENMFALTDLKRLHQYLEVRLNGALKEVLYKFNLRQKVLFILARISHKGCILTLPKSLLYVKLILAKNCLLAGKVWLAYLKWLCSVHFVLTRCPGKFVYLKCITVCAKFRIPFQLSTSY